MPAIVAGFSVLPLPHHCFSLTNLRLRRICFAFVGRALGTRVLGKFYRAYSDTRRVHAWVLRKGDGHGPKALRSGERGRSPERKVMTCTEYLESSPPAISCDTRGHRSQVRSSPENAGTNERGRSA